MKQRKTALDPSREKVTPKPSPGVRRQIESQADVTATVHCPLCGHPLVALIGATGPFFYCNCIVQQQCDSRLATSGGN